MANSTAGQTVQLGWFGHVVADRVAHVRGIKPVFSLTVEMKGSWAK
jgi:hypothetical protein